MPASAHDPWLTFRILWYASLSEVPGAFMDIHKPKAAHSLREFLTEIGTIVCGILIALGLEQAVETAHWAEKVHEAREAIHHELVQATVFAEERLNRQACRDAYLAELATAIATSPGHWRPRPQTWCGVQHNAVYSGAERPWPTEAWRSIVSEGTVSHFPVRYRQQAPFTFNFIGLINDRVSGADFRATLRRS